MPTSERKRLRDQERKRKQAEALGIEYTKTAKIESDAPLPPALEDESAEEYKMSIQLASALYEGCLHLLDSKCTVSLLGSHYKVNAIKKGDERLKGYRLVEMIKRHPDIFDVEQEGEQSAQWPVKLVENAKENLAVLQQKAGVPTLEEEEAQDDSGIPDAELPEDHSSGLQQVRVACAKALLRRNKTAALHDICQDRMIGKLKNCFDGDKVIERIMGMFPDNFTIESQPNGHKECILVSNDVTDTSMLEELCQKKGKEWPVFKGIEAGGRKKSGGGGGGGKGKGKGGKGGKDARMWEAMAAKGFASFLYLAKGKGWGKA